MPLPSAAFKRGRSGSRCIAPSRTPVPTPSMAPSPSGSIAMGSVSRVRLDSRIRRKPMSSPASMRSGLCYICDEYPPVSDAYGGMGIAFREQAEAFARRGRRVSVICRTTARETGVHRINGVNVHVVAPSIVPKARAVVDRLKLDALVRQIRGGPNDIVISAEYAGPLLVRTFRNPLVVHLEGS